MRGGREWDVEVRGSRAELSLDCSLTISLGGNGRATIKFLGGDGAAGFKYTDAVGSIYLSSRTELAIGPLRDWQPSPDMA